MSAQPFRSWVEDYAAPSEQPINREAFRMRAVERARTKMLQKRALDGSAAPDAVGRHSSLAAKQRVAAARRAVGDIAAEALRAADPVERARVHLQRRGAIVYRADVVDGPAGRWVVSGRPGFHDDAGLVAIALRTGFRESGR